MAFVPPSPLRAPSRTDCVVRRPCAVRRARSWRLCARSDGRGWLDSPGSVARAWESARRAACQTDLGRRHVAVLFVSGRCERALLMERAFTVVAEQRSRSRRLLVHSAGLDCEPGAELPHALLTFAAEHGLSVVETQPCARFDVTDFDFYDLVLAVDRNVRDRLCARAAARARTAGAQLADWERKIRLATDIDDECVVYSPAHPLDLPTFSEHSDPRTTMLHMQDACGRIFDTLIQRGL